MVKRLAHKTTFTFKKGTPEDVRVTLRHMAATMKHLLVMGKPYTWPEFAELVAQNYTSQQAAEMVKVARNY